MQEAYSHGERRSTQSFYESYTGGGRRQASRGLLSSPSAFREGMSSYSMRSGKIQAGSLSEWDMNNCSGAPMDYDSASGTVYVDGSDGHSLLIGSTGSKKSRLVVMPTIRLLSSCGESMVACDPKGELYRRTAGFLEKQGYRIHAINLREPTRGDGWNIFTVPYQFYLDGQIDKACEYINDIANNLIPIMSRDPFWDYSARDMFFGLTLLLFRICREKKQEPVLVNMRSLLKLRSELFSSVSSPEIKSSALWRFAERDDLTRIRLQGIVICPADTMSCIISMFDQHMACFSLQPQMVDLLSCSTFDLKNIGFGKDAIFLIMPDEKSTYHQIVAIFLKQMYEMLIDNAQNVEDYRYPVRVNFVLDEFSSLPTIPDMPQMIAASRSRNIRFILVVQSKHQLRQRYHEETDTIMSNCNNWIFLTSREMELLREVSELSGTTGSNREPLISIPQLQYLDKKTGECLIFSGRKPPYFAHLPDIEVYDQGHYTVRPLLPRQPPSQPDGVYFCPDYFEQLVTETHKKPVQKINPDSPLRFHSLNDVEIDDVEIDDVEIDALIKDIDRQIEELNAIDGTDQTKDEGGS